ncbi:hypothetical protein [Peribacillus sp. FSL R5-0717]|uniref:hypothetical protein n=1 Tax=Peribacillus sp. FSL R5-0717 TaxID=2975308 RepID=UPI0030FA6595
MFTFKKITVGFLVIWGLAACDNEQEMVIKPERVDVREGNEVQKSKPQDNVPSYEAPSIIYMEVG